MSGRRAHDQPRRWAGMMLMLVAAAGVGCATMAPEELVSARDAYSRAAAGPAARLAPGDLLAARTALDDAEHALSKEHDVDKTRDLAYVAQRKAQLAQARADELAALTPGTQ